MSEPVIQVQSNEISNSNRPSEAELALFLGKNATYYLKHWKKDGFYGWNWAAFWGSFFWLVYRKMYLQALGLIVLLGLLAQHGFGFFIAAGMCISANTMYYLHVRHQIWKIKRKTVDPEGQQRLLIKKGGTNWIAVWVMLGFFLLLALMNNESDLMMLIRRLRN